MLAPAELRFSNDEILEHYPKFFKHYPFSVENTKIGEVFKNNFEVAKKKMRDFLPFAANGRAMIAKYTDSNITNTEALAKTLDALTEILCRCSATVGESSARKAVFRNSMPNGAKVSKYILQKADNIGEAEVKRILIRNDLCIELPLLPLAKRDDLATVVQNYYSEKAKIKDVQVCLYLTVNPYDIANVSNDKFSSCNALGSMHETAPLCAQSSETMAVIRLEREDTGEQLGRCYIAFSPDFKSFVVQPVYGYMQESFVQDARVWLKAVIDAKLKAQGVELKPWKVYHGPTNIRPEEAHEVANANFYVDSSSSCAYREDFVDIPAVRVGGNRCLICGESGTRLVCNKCRSNCGQCKICGALCAPDQKMCPRHIDMAHVCITCGVDFFDEVVEETMCQNCRNTRSVCALCGDAFDVYHGPVKWRQERNPEEILGGVLYAHKACLAHKTRCKCGNICNPYDTMCTLCRNKQNAMHIANKIVVKFNDYRRRLTGFGTAMSNKFNPGVLIPTEEYAMAA